MTEQEKRSAVLAVCKKYLGTKEIPAGSNNVFFNTRFYGVEVKDGFNLKGLADKNASWQWCGTSVSEIFIEAGFPLGNIGWLRGYSSVPYAIENIHKWGRIIPIEQAQPGDIAMIDFQKDGKSDHTGIISSISDSKNCLYIFEGNTSNNASGHQSNGGEFCYKDRIAANIGLIIVRPNAYDHEYLKPIPVKIKNQII